MKYREVSKTCAVEGCDKARFGRHRKCKPHMNEYEAARRKKSAEPEKLLAKAIREIKKRPEGLSAESMNRLAALAAEFAKHLDPPGVELRRAG